MPVEPRRATTFLITALAWSLGLFALLRTPWVEQRLVLPLTHLQKQAADYYAGSPSVPVAVTLECSGTDVLALCLAAILACPVPWRARLTGAAGGVAFVLGLNTVRIATLGRAASSPALFSALHLQVWPAILVLATSGYVFAWMGKALGASRRVDPLLLRRFAPRAAVLLVAFALCGPWIARSDAREAGAFYGGTADAQWTGGYLRAEFTPRIDLTFFGRYDWMRHGKQPLEELEKSFGDRDAVTAGMCYTFSYSSRADVGWHVEFADHRTRLGRPRRPRPHHEAVLHGHRFRVATWPSCPIRSSP